MNNFILIMFVLTSIMLIISTIMLIKDIIDWSKSEV